MKLRLRFAFKNRSEGTVIYVVDDQNYNTVGWIDETPGVGAFIKLLGSMDEVSKKYVSVNEAFEEIKKRKGAE